MINHKNYGEISKSLCKFHEYISSATNKLDFLIYYDYFIYLFQNVFVHCGSSDPLEINSFFSILGKCSVQKNDGGLLETCLEFDVVTAVTQIRVVPINSVPIMLTALSKDLASPMGWSNLHGQSRSG